jgi:DNA-binding transcriptional MerR regulator
MSKAQEAFRTISEVADELGVPKHVLRFWEVKFPQVRPMKRGGGRRYYRPEDLELLRGIRHLLHAEAYTIKGVQKILREQGIDAVKDIARAAAAAAEAKGPGRGRRRRRAATPEAVAETAPPPAEVPGAGRAEATSGAMPGAQRSLETTPARKPAGASARGAREAAASAERTSTRQIVEAAIAELQACRSILLGEEEAAPARRVARRTRAARS